MHRTCRSFWADLSRSSFSAPRPSSRPDVDHAPEHGGAPSGRLGFMARMLPSVSIVIPAYNEEETIRACVVAALEQTVAAHEIIVVDNKSTDATAAIVHALQATYSGTPIIYLQQFELQGLIPTRNFGLNHASGDVIGRIDADALVAVLRGGHVDLHRGLGHGPQRKA